jgi:hypothetical protein
MFRQNGSFNLPTLMIALTISAIISYYMYASSSSQARVSQLEQINLSAEIIGKAIGEYYISHCSDPLFVNPTLDDLVDNIIESDVITDLPLNITFLPTVEGIGTGDVRFVVSASMADVATAQWFNRNSPNTVVTGTRVSWIYKASHNATSNGIRPQQLRAAFGNNQC